MSEDNNSGLTRRRVLGGIATVGAASAAAGAGTMAYFSDTEDSTGNTVSAGTLNLDDVADDNLSISNLAPGNEVTATWTLVNSGSIDADHVEVAASYSESDGSGSPDNTTNVGAKPFAQMLNVTTLSYAGQTLDPSTEIGNTDSDNKVTLHDLAQNGIDDLTPAPGAGGGSNNFKIGLTLDSGVGNDYQNDGVDATFTFTLNQDSGQ